MRTAKLATKPQGYWSVLENQRKFLDKLVVDAAPGGEESIRGWTNTERFYHVQRHHFQEHGGVGMLKHYNNSPSLAVVTVYPEHQWHAEKFSRVMYGYWESVKNQRDYCDKLVFVLLGLSSLDQCYGVQVREFQDNCASGLAFRYKNSAKRLFMALYPEHRWDESQFRAKLMDQGLLLQSLTKSLRISKLEDWYSVSLEQVRTVTGACTLKKSLDLLSLLQRYHPNHAWDVNRLARRNKRAMQRWARCLVSEMFHLQEWEVLEEYRHPNLVYSRSGMLMQLDIYLPRLSLAIEYQGEQHFMQLGCTPRLHPEISRGYDEEKARACAEQGISLVVVPYWWDGKKDSLREAVLAVRPDLIVKPMSQSQIE